MAKASTLRADGTPKAAKDIWAQADCFLLKPMGFPDVKVLFM